MQCSVCFVVVVWMYDFVERLVVVTVWSSMSLFRPQLRLSGELWAIRLHCEHMKRQKDLFNCYRFKAENAKSIMETVYI